MISPTGDVIDVGWHEEHDQKFEGSWDQAFRDGWIRIVAAGGEDNLFGDMEIQYRTLTPASLRTLIMYISTRRPYNTYAEFAEPTSASSNTSFFSGTKNAWKKLINWLRQGGTTAVQVNESEEDAKYSMENNKPKFSFIQEELAEARLFRGAKSLQKHSSSSVAETVMSNVLMLEIMRHENPSWAQTYARRTMQFGGRFDAMRPAGTDLHNLISALNSPQAVEKYMANDPIVQIPDMRTKRYFRDMLAGRSNPSSTREFLLKFERSMNISSGPLRSVRRVVADWDKATPGERQMATSRLMLHMNQGKRIEDMYAPFAKMAKKKNYMDKATAGKKGLPLWAKAGAAAAVGYALGRKFNA